MPDVKIRKYREEDLKGIKGILSGLKSPTGRAYNAKEMLSDALRETDGVFVAIAEDKVSGFAIVVFKEWLHCGCQGH